MLGSLVRAVRARVQRPRPGRHGLPRRLGRAQPFRVLLQDPQPVCVSCLLLSCLLLARALVLAACCPPACLPSCCLLAACSPHLTLCSPSQGRARVAALLCGTVTRPASEPVTFTCLICCASTSEVIRYASVVCQGGGGTGQDAQASDERLLATAHREVRLDDQSGLARRCPVLLVRRGPAEVRSDARDLPLLLCCSCCCRRRMLRF